MKHARDVENIIALNAIRRRRVYNSVGNHVRAFLTWRTPTGSILFNGQSCSRQMLKPYSKAWCIAYTPSLTIREHSYPPLAPLAEDFISAPAPHAYIERVFSDCGYLCCRKPNRATKCLERREFLKMNRKLVSA